jgi:cytochrome P450
MGNSDPPVHGQLRSIVNRCFTPRVMDAVRESVRTNVEALLESGSQGEAFDVMPGLAEPLAVSTVLQHLGIPPEGWERVRQWSLAMMRVRAEDEDARVFGAAEEARGEMLDYLAQVAQLRGQADEERNDVLTAVLDATDAEAIDPDQLLMMLIHISLAGNGPTAMAIGNAVKALGETPGQLNWLLEHLESLPAAVEELLRYDPSTHFVARFALDDAMVGGRTVRKGQQVHVMVGAANRDPARFTDPDDLDLTRADNRHLTFGYGIHFCLGAPLARIELEVALKAVLEKFGLYEIVRAERGGTYQMRGLSRLEIRPGHNE